MQRRCDPPWIRTIIENPDLVDACAKHGITFIGPKQKQCALVDKASARQVAIATVFCHSRDGRLGRRYGQIAKDADEIGYPLMLKASWGGGGRGMRPSVWMSFRTNC